MKAIGGIWMLLIFSGCQQSREEKLNSAVVCETTESPYKDANLLDMPNPQVLKALRLPKTITYLGVKKPQSLVKNTPPSSGPSEMVYVPGGHVQMGAENGLPQETPMFWATVKAFYMDVSPVTVAQFRAFVKATKYKTEAEVFGNAGVITDETDKKWVLVDGACWEYPLGKNQAKAKDNHPVTQVSWNDATAYAQWAGKRLPCEIEWEHAARNARNSRDIYPWGNEIEINGTYKGNIWQGKFPYQNFNKDGFRYTSPVGRFGKTELGLTDMVGNVWEWCANPKFDYSTLFLPTATEVSSEYAQRGGSFLCEPTWCHGYRVSGRSSSTPETSLFHLGFRCVKDLE